MAKAKKISTFHPDNPHQGHYDFDELVRTRPALKKFMSMNPRGQQTINFFEPEAVRLLNQALLQVQHGIEHWDVPPGHLIPPVPGRADYIFYLSDVIQKNYSGQIKCLDIGVGANAIYSLLGAKAKHWKMIGSDISTDSLQHARQIIATNKLEALIELRHQADSMRLFESIIRPNEYFHATLCNPPFHGSAEDAVASSRRKVNNLTGRRHKKPVKNFGGQANELWIKGGERGFLSRMIAESVAFRDQVGVFSTLVSKESNVKPLLAELRTLKVPFVKTIDLQTGNKKSRILCWGWAGV